MIGLSVVPAASAASSDQPTAQASSNDGTFSVDIERGDQALRANDYRAAKTAYLSALAYALAEAGRGPTSAQGSQKIAAAFVKLAALDEETNSQPGALESYRDELDAERRLVQQYPSNLQLSTSFALALSAYGKSRSSTDVSEALAVLEESLSIYRSVAAKPGDDQAASRKVQEGEASTLAAIGTLKQSRADQSAISDLREAADIRESIAKRAVGDLDAQNALFGALSMLGLAKSQNKDEAGALSAFQENVDWMRSSASQANSNQSVYFLLVALNVLGNERLSSGDTPGATTTFNESVIVGRDLVRKEPNNASFKTATALAVRKLGESDLKAGNAKAALPLLEESAEILRKLIDEQPSDQQARLGLPRTLDLLGLTKGALNDSPGALAAFQESVRCWRKMLASNPANVTVQTSLALDLSRVGLLGPDSTKQFVEATSIVKNLEALGALPPEAKDLGRIVALAWRESMQNAARNVSYEGGDGSTMEDAIIIKGVHSDEQGTMAELAFIGAHIQECNLTQQALVGRAGRQYHSIKCGTPDGVIHTLFFDITEYLGKH